MVDLTGMRRLRLPFTIDLVSWGVIPHGRGPWPAAHCRDSFDGFD